MNHIPGEVLSFIKARLTARQQAALCERRFHRGGLGLRGAARARWRAATLAYVRRQFPDAFPEQT
jgi:hypothetical protein